MATVVWSNSTAFLHPLVAYGPFQGNMTLNTLDLMLIGQSFTSTQSTGSFGFTLRVGLYTLANDTQLSLLNSFSSTISRTSQSFATRNNEFANLRFLTVHSSQWSAQPVLSDGVNYWLLYMASTAGVNVLSGIAGQQVAGVINTFKGLVGVAQSVAQSSGFAPFWGALSANAIPGDISRLTPLSNANVASSFIVGVQARMSVSL